MERGLLQLVLSGGSESQVVSLAWRSYRCERETLPATHDSIGRQAWPVPWIGERIGH
jgi:hypothetical protein